MAEVEAKRVLRNLVHINQIVRRHIPDDNSVFSWPSLLEPQTSQIVVAKIINVYVPQHTEIVFLYVIKCSPY
jgi:hypothetical protein